MLPDWTDGDWELRESVQDDGSIHVYIGRGAIYERNSDRYVKLWTPLGRWRLERARRRLGARAMAYNARRLSSEAVVDRRD